MDLNAPLGMKPPSRRPRVAPIIAVALVAVGLAGAGAFFLTTDPNGGETVAVATIPPPPPPKPVAPALPPPTAPDPMPTGSIAGQAAGDTTRIEHGVKIVSPAVPGRAEPRDAGPMVIDVSKALDAQARKTASNQQQQSATPQARPVGEAANRPRIAIFVGGMGLSDVATRTAIEILPPAVTLAFLPYGETVAASVASARARGHEILLQVPMQGPKGATPGPHALRADEPAAELAGDLDWLTSRFDGYAGATNLLGAAVTDQDATMSAVIGRLGQRGLFYVDDGTSRLSVAPAVASRLGAPAVQADVVLDATGDPAVVRANLERLAAIAKAKGSAVGMASGLSDHLSTIARFATELDERGITLVPVGTLAHRGASVATTR